MFTRRRIVALLIPLMLEQFLSGLMGIADTMMVTSVGETAISAVSSVDSINTLVLNLLAALSAGGVIVCSQYLGRKQGEQANHAARQVMLVSVGLAAALMAVCLVLRGPLLSLIFGAVEETVMEQALDYFLITAISYPLYGGAADRLRGVSRRRTLGCAHVRGRGGQRRERGGQRDPDLRIRSGCGGRRLVHHGLPHPQRGGAAGAAAQ